jgi:hypothetical protein
LAAAKLIENAKCAQSGKEGGIWRKIFKDLTAEVIVQTLVNAIFN